MEEFDVIVIGSGPGGEKAAVKAAHFGYKVAVIEKLKLAFKHMYNFTYVKGFFNVSNLS